MRHRFRMRFGVGIALASIAVASCSTSPGQVAGTTSLPATSLDSPASSLPVDPPSVTDSSIEPSSEPPTQSDLQPSSEVQSEPSSAPATPVSAGGTAYICTGTTAELTVFTINTASGAITTILSGQPASGERIQTQQYGTVQFQPTDVTGWTNGSTASCQGPQWDPKHTSLAGSVEIPNGNTVAAYLKFSVANGSDLYIRGKVEQSTGFAAGGDTGQFVSSEFDLAGKLWWITRPDSSDDQKIEVFEDGAPPMTYKFSSEVDLSTTTDTTMEFGADGTWAVKSYQHNDIGSPEWISSDGKSYTTDPLKQPARLSKPLSALVPKTNYAFGPWAVSTDRKTIGFVATSPAGEAGFFSVPIEGGSPTQLTKVDLSALGAMQDEMVYYNSSGD